MLDRIIRDLGRKLNAHPVLDSGSLVHPRAEVEQAGIEVIAGAQAVIFTREPIAKLVQALGDIGVGHYAHHCRGQGVHHFQNWLALDLSEQLAGANDSDNCPGCGYSPGDGLNPDCSHPGGCGYFRSLDVEI